MMEPAPNSIPICHLRPWAVALALFASISLAAPSALAAQPGIVKEEFIYTEAPFEQCHASTIAETPVGLVAAWFGGTEEGEQDVGIWLSRHNGESWSPPVEVANGMQADGKRHTCWNPVLFQPPEGPLLLFIKVGPSPRSWWGELMTSEDSGRTWSKPAKLPEAGIGPVKNKPLLLTDGTLLCGSSTEHDGWRVHFERTTDLGKTWRRDEVIDDTREFNAIQPTILAHGEARLQVLCRSREGHVVESWSDDNGRTWSGLKATSLPNPNSGIDAVTLADGRHLLVYNHTGRLSLSPRDREMLNVAVGDDGKRWQAALVLEKEPGEFSYPAVIQTKDGLVHLTYTHQRLRVKHVVVDPSKLELREFEDGKWPFSDD